MSRPKTAPGPKRISKRSYRDHCRAKEPDKLRQQVLCRSVCPDIHSRSSFSGQLQAELGLPCWLSLTHPLVTLQTLCTADMFVFPTAVLWRTASHKYKSNGRGRELNKSMRGLFFVSVCPSMVEFHFSFLSVLWPFIHVGFQPCEPFSLCLAKHLTIKHWPTQKKDRLHEGSPQGYAG